MSKLTIKTASVTVMRSHDYCHFEVALTADVECPPDSPEWFQQVDALRKNAARLADKAVAQYKIAKKNLADHEGTTESLEYRAEVAERIPEAERTPEQIAAIKALSDYRFNARHYDYQDDWQDND